MRGKYNAPDFVALVAQTQHLTVLYGIDNFRCRVPVTLHLGWGMWCCGIMLVDVMSVVLRLR